MKPAVVLYATREGHARKIAEHVAAALRERSVATDLFDVAHLPQGFALGRYGAAVLVASVHLGKHEREMIVFARRERAALGAMPTSFLSVSLSEAAVEDASRPAAARAKATADVGQMIDRFLAETELHPSLVHPVAGALVYSKYGFLTKLVMRSISRREGGPVDTSRDYELTDWEAVDRYVAEIAERAGAPPA